MKSARVAGTVVMMSGVWQSILNCVVVVSRILKVPVSTEHTPEFGSE